MHFFSRHQRSAMLATLILAWGSIIAPTTTVNAFSCVPRSNGGQRSSVSTRTTRTSLMVRHFMVNAANLPTNLEWLANDRDQHGEEDGSGKTTTDVALEWFDPLNMSPENKQEEEAGNESASTAKEQQQRLRLRMPLYPLDACYLPSKTTQFINNVESRNIQMMQDISAGERNEFNFAEHNTFCVTLRAADTGRLCRIGTLMRVVNLEEQLSYGGEVRRIVTTCVPEDRMEISHVENPDRKPGEYYIAQTSPYFDVKQKSPGNVGISSNPLISNHDAQLLEQIKGDFTAVRFLYVNGDGVALRELPPFAAEAVQKIPRISVEDLQDPERFWKAADAWQTLCNTVKEGRRVVLQSDMNEIMIDAAMKKGGPLNLPVKRDELPFDVRKILQKKEETAMQDFHALGMDPCLEFQFLIASNSHQERVELLGAMIARERRRLQAKESLKSMFGQRSSDDDYQ
jgi:hypothetical protein